ncbi:MAG: redoxin domain-containing protein [Clostridium sp.]|nr:redoxin domain-containing protein [Clostridium sp.]
MDRFCLDLTARFFLTIKYFFLHHLFLSFTYSAHQLSFFIYLSKDHATSFIASEIVGYLLKDSDLVIVAIDIGESLSTVKPFIESNKYNFKVLIDSDQSVANQYNISAIPTSYFIDEDCNIISKNVGAMNIEQMKEYIKTLDK